MSKRDEQVREEVRSAFEADTSHAKARTVVERVLDLHHEYRGNCYECSLRAPMLGVAYPCRTVRGILDIVRERER